MPRIHLSAEELTALIKKSDRYPHSVAVSYGPSGAWLTEKDGEIVSKWALPTIADMRGIPVTAEQRAQHEQADK